MLRKPTLTVIAALFISINLINATNYYVSNQGNDSNNGLSEANAWRTLQHAADNVMPGDSILVAEGNYNGFDIRSKGATAQSPIVFFANGQDVIIDQPGPIRNDGINIENADFIIIDGFTVINMPGNGNGIRVVLSNGCEIRNNFCDNNAERGIFTGFTDDILIENNLCTNALDEHGIYVSNSSDRPIIRYNICSHNDNIGIHMNGDLSAGGDGIISNPVIYGNVIFENNLAAGINLDGVLNAEIYNNLIYNNHFSQGIALFQQDGAIMSHDADIFNNTIIVPEDGRWGILLKNGAQVNTRILNNIIHTEHSWRGSIAAEQISGLISDHNLLSDRMSYDGDGTSVSLNAWKKQGLDSASIEITDPRDLFVDYLQNDYHLDASSVAVDNGNTDIVQNLVTHDIDGLERPLGKGYDIGCYELEPISTSISNLELMVDVFPNPSAQQNITLEGPSDVLINQLAIIGTDGRHIIRVAKFAFPLSLDVSSLPSGTYHCFLIVNQGQPLVKTLIVK